MQETESARTPLAEESGTRTGRLVNSLLWAVALTLGLVLTAMLTQIGTWGLVAGVVVGLAVIALVAIVVGGMWQRGVIATLACVVAFAAMMFAGPAAYEVYMRSVGQPAPALVLEVAEPDDTLVCFVVETTGATTLHEMDQRQNCFGHISAGQAVTIFKDPVGFVPPRLENAPDDTSATTEVVIATALLAAAGATVLYGGLRRRTVSPVGHLPPTAQAAAGVHDGAVSERDDTQASADDGRPPQLLWLDRGPADDGGWQVRGTDAVKIAERTYTRTLAHAEVQLAAGSTPGDYRKARKAGARSFVLWADAGHRDVLARVVTASARRCRTAGYEVVGARGETLASVTRRPGHWFLLRRARWSIQQSGQAAAVARKGHPISWMVWFMTLPCQPVIVLLSLFGGDGMEPVRPPLRTTWRIDGTIVLDHSVGTATGSGTHVDGLHVLADWWDPRVAAALVALIRSHNGWMGGRWDRAGR